MIKKMCGFRNIRIRVDGAFMSNATIVHVSNPTCYEFKIHFRSFSLPLVFLSLSLFSLVLVLFFFWLLVFLSWFLEL